VIGAAPSKPLSTPSSATCDREAILPQSAQSSALKRGGKTVLTPRVKCPYKAAKEAAASGREIILRERFMSYIRMLLSADAREPVQQSPPYRGVPKVQRKRDGCTVVAHISDLHFTATTAAEAAIWEALRQDLGKTGADILVVTGDLIDCSVGDNLQEAGVSQALDRVHTFIAEGLCGELAIDPAEALIVVPGNHDYRWKGLVSKQTYFDLFHEKFRPYYGHSMFPALRLCVFCFDSNTVDRGVNFATGLVAEEELVAFAAAVDEIKKVHLPTWLESTRLAVVHHHPMPIAATEHRAGVTDREEFLLLKNAGLFMTELVRAEIDLVVHGHKHYPSFSRATFRPQEGSEQTIMVLGAGSVAGKGQEPSYNMVTLHDNGEVLLERRWRRAAAYERKTEPALQTYEMARAARFERLAKAAGVKLRVRRATRLDRLGEDAGDDEIHWHFEGARSNGKDPIGEIETTARSDSGYFGEEEYEWEKPLQDIRCREKRVEGNANAQRRVVAFDPPIGKEPVTFGRRRTIHNAIHYNQRDRLDATGGQRADEWLALLVTNAIELLIFGIMFPEGRFPSEVTVRVYRETTQRDEAEQRDSEEEAYARQRVLQVRENRLVTLTIEKALPGYRYEIGWELPPDETEELDLTAAQAGMAREIGERLLAARQSRPAGPVQDALGLLRTEVVEDRAGEDLEVTLFCYDRDVNALVCVGGVGDYEPQSRLWTWEIKPGRTIVGQAYRRRDTVLYIQVPGVEIGTEYYEPVPEESGRPREPHTVIFAVPLFYPVARGRRVGVLSIASRSNVTSLLQLENDEAAVCALLEHVTAWYAKRLSAALGIWIPLQP
jgi:3',5'-cyclic AMP phosphodiesterase CpdA